MTQTLDNQIIIAMQNALYAYANDEIFTYEEETKYLLEKLQQKHPEKNTPQIQERPPETDGPQ